MEEVRQLVQEEGREARNLVAFHVAVDTPSRVSRKPPRGAPPPRLPAPRSAARLRSASAGRDKRSELRARYWALLFGDLQRAVGEIYNTVEAHENQNECQEVILVLENYTRDFKALSEWFRLKWEYDNTPPPQRPQSLAWEIRKTDFVRPESRRTHSVKSSPSVSGKNSPCLSGHNTPSGKNSPNLTGKASPGSGKISPRISGHSTSPKGSIEFFSNKIVTKTASKPEPKVAKETRLSDIKEKETVAIEDDKMIEKVGEIKENNKNEFEKNVIEIEKPTENCNSIGVKDKENDKPFAEPEKSNDSTTVIVETNEKELQKPLVEIGKAKEIQNVTPKPVIVKSTKRGRSTKEDIKVSSDIELSSQAKTTIAKLEAMENEFLTKNVTETAAINENLLNQDVEKDSSAIVTEPLAEETTPGSPSRTDNLVDSCNESSSQANSNNEKPFVANIPDDKIIDNDAKVATDNKTKAIVTKKKEVLAPKKDIISKLVKEVLAKDSKTSETKDKKESNKKAANDTKPEPLKKDDSPKDDQTLNCPEDCEPEIKKNKDTKNVANVNTDEKKESVNDEKKTESKSPEPNDEAKDTKTSKDVKEDKDSKKIEPKHEARPPVRPAYSQAAAKPKLVTAKDEIKTPTKALYRSKTVVEIRPNSAPNRQLRQFPNRNQKNKCSYPFNLTTGRTSLFDAPGVTKVVATKRQIVRPQMAAGDVRNQIKPDLKNRPPRPNSLKIPEEGDNKQEKNNPAFEKIKDCDEYSSSDTIVTQIDMSRIESSESLKTIVPENDFANSIEVLNIEDKNDNEGWLTVKSRRLSRESKKSKSHWANRFHQPSATTSLPTLNMIESPKSETNPIVDLKIDRAKSEQPQNKPEKSEKVVIVADKKEPKTTPVKDTSMIRQKSDVTGLKTRSSRNKALKKDKNRDKKDSELTKNRLHSSLESLTTGLARSQESTEEEAFDFDKWKAEFMTTFKYLEEDDQMTNHNEILKTADPSEMSEIAEMTSQIEENERKISLALDFQSEADQKKLCEEEDLLNRQIMELQQVSDNDLDTETDDTETDAEILCDDSHMAPCQPDKLHCRDLASCLEHHYESALEGMSWSERIDMLGALEELVARDPGRAQQLHAKLSAGMKRRGSLQDVLRRLQAKQARAERQRMLLHTERAKKIHQLLGRVEEVKMAKNQLIEEKRNRMERRLQKAAENRDQHLKDIVRKAHDEEEKLREIAFIKQLEAENRRHEFLDQCRSYTTRLREMRRERLHKLEQKAAREAAVGARRQAIEAARKLHVESLLEKRKERDARREELKELKKQERDDAAREKAEGVKSRLSALAAAAELEADALRSRIRDKQDASQQRLESHLQAIREKATGPRQPTTSESQETTTKEQDEEVARIEQERKERERQKTLRKKARKLKLKILSTSKDDPPVDPTVYAFISPALGKTQRVVNQLAHLIQPLVLDHKPNACELDGVKLKKSEATPKPEFRYDFEDKIGKKKKKKKFENNQAQKNNQKSETKKDLNTKHVNDVTMKNTRKMDDTQTINDSKTEINNHVAANGCENNQMNLVNTQRNKNDTQSNKNDTQNAHKDRNQRNETQKLSKSNSICSSVSDMSKASMKCEKLLVSLDIPLLEKLIGELYRMITPKDCNDNLKPKVRKPELSLVTKQHVVKTLGQLLSVLAEREDLLAQLSHKCVCMVVSCASAALSSCSGGARADLAFFESPAAAHTVTMLYNQLGKDLTDPKEMELAKLLADLISVTLDSALCESRLRSGDGDDADMVTAMRARAHNIISYLCLTGCLARAEHAGEARERVQTLVTLCADLCQPHKCDTGPERSSAVQSLRGALGTGLMGSRAEFCMLFAAGAALSRAQDFVRCARTAHLLRQLAQLDHLLVQEAFGEGGWPLEFRAAVARLLSQHAPNDKEAPTSDAPHLSNQRLDLNLSEQMVLDLIVLVGFVVVNNPQLHDTICENWGVIKTLCTLPANWLVSEYHSPSLLPTLVVLADRPATAKVIQSELSLKMLENYMNSPEGQKMKLIQILKAARDKATKKQGKREKHNSNGDNQINKDNSNTGPKNNNVKEVLTNGVKKEQKIAYVSDTDSVEDEV